MTHRPDSDPRPDADARSGAAPRSASRTGTTPEAPGRAEPGTRGLDPHRPGAALEEIFGGRAGGAWTRGVVLLSWPMALVLALWIAAGRCLFGAGGSLVGVFFVSLFPLYLMVAGLAAAKIVRDARRRPGRRTTPTLAGVQLISWLLALVFGFLVPDATASGDVVSAASKVFGPDVVGLSAGFGNTFGILTYVGAFAVLFLAWGQERRSRLGLEGRPATEDEILDAQGYEGEESYDPPNYWQ